MINPFLISGETADDENSQTNTLLESNKRKLHSFWNFLNTQNILSTHINDDFTIENSAGEWVQSLPSRNPGLQYCNARMEFGGIIPKNVLERLDEQKNKPMLTLGRQFIDMKEKKLNFFKEIETLVCKKHKNVLDIEKVFFDIKDKDECWMTFISKQLKMNFAEMRRATPSQTVEDFRFILSSCLEGLNHLHENKIIHLNLNFQNLYIDMNGDCVIWGIGENFDFHRIATSKDLTAQEKKFMAPEVLNSYKTKRSILDDEENDKLEFKVMDKDQYFTTKADIYSFGMILYDIFIEKDSETPNFAKINEETIYHTLLFEFSIWRTLVFENFVTELVEIIKTALDPNPNARPSAKYLLEKYQFFKKELFIQKELEETFRLGLKYDEDEGLNRDPFKAQQYFELAASKGHFPSQFFQGCLLSLGLGGKCDRKSGQQLTIEGGLKAFNYFEHMAAKGDRHSQVALGIIYDSGKTVKQDFKKAMEYYEQSAAQGHAGAILSMGFLHENGEGVPKNMKKAIELYKLAAEKGDVSALHQMGLCYDVGYRSLPRDIKKAVEYYEKAAAKGNGASMVKLGLCYNLGVVFEKNLEIAKEKYRMAAELNDPAGNYELGMLYADGEGVEKDVKKAVEYLKKAVEQDYGEAFDALGTLYENEEDLDESLALQYHKKGALLGNARCMFSLADSYLSRTNAETDPNIPYDLFREAAKGGLAEAQLAMSDFYMQGGPFGVNEERGYHYLKLADKYCQSERGDAKFTYATSPLIGSMEPPNYLFSEFLLEQAAKDEDLKEMAQERIDRLMEDGKHCFEQNEFFFTEMSSSLFLSCEK